MATVEGGFPHSEIHGSMPVRGSPWLIAAYHVLHRLSAPRHPPDTLITLDRSHYRCPSRDSPSRQPRRHRRSDIVTDDAGQDLCFRTCPGWEAVKASHHLAPRHPRRTGAASHDASPTPVNPRGGVDPPGSVRPTGCACRASRSRSAGHIHSSRCRITRLGKARRCANRRSRWRISEGGRGRCQGRRLRCRRWVRSEPSRLASPPKRWWSKTGSNRRPHACKARALPTELLPREGEKLKGSAVLTGGPGKTRTSDLTLIKRAL